MSIEGDLQEQERQRIRAAAERAISRYIETRKARVPAFVAKHFSFRGALRLNRKALGMDLLKGPANVFWALPYTLVRATSGVVRLARGKRVASYLDRLPHGFETEVQKEITWLIYTELLELPCRQRGRSSVRDALLEEILKEPEVADLIARYLSEISAKSADPEFRGVLEEHLREYASSRTATADLAGSVLTLAASYAVFKQAGPGSFFTGTLVANTIAQQVAVSNFWLGSTLGSWYYGLFPAAASAGLLAASIGTIMAVLAVLTTFAGVVADPLQARLGIHERRLMKLVGSVEEALAGSTESTYRLKDQYVARVFDILDLLKTAAKAMYG
ncbi:MAG: DUF6635 family protein [bacterium]